MDYRILETYKPESAYLIEDNKGKRFVLKKNTLRAAVRFSDFLRKKNHPLIKHVPGHFPLPSGAEAEYLREYFEGEVAGNSTYLFGFSASAFEKINPKEIVRAVVEIQRLKPRRKIFGDLEIRDASWYLERLDEPKEALETLVGEGTYEKVKSQMSEFKEIVDAETKYLANGDLHPKNILLLTSKNQLSRPSNFIVLDWDLLHINNPAYDLSFLYLWGWRNRNWRQQILGEYSAFNRNFETCFKFCVAYLSSQLMKHGKIILEKFVAEDERARKKLGLDFISAMSDELKNII